MAKRFAVVRHFELTCEQPAARKERERKKRPVGMAKDFDFQMLVIYVVFKLTIQVDNTTTPKDLTIYFIELENL